MISNGVEKLVELKFEFFSFNTFDVSQIFWQRFVQPRPQIQLLHSLVGIVLGLCLLDTVTVIINNMNAGSPIPKELFL